MKNPQRRRENDADALARSQQILVLRQIHVIGNRTNLLRQHRILGPVSSKRTFVAVLLRHALKLRYWVAGGVFGGSIAASNWYEEWKRSLPEIELPEWAKFDENPFLKISAKYDDLRAKWAERDLAHLTEWKNKLSNFEIQWKTRDDADLQGQLLWLGSSVGDNRFRSAGPTNDNLNKSSSEDGGSLFSIFGSKSSKKEDDKSDYKHLSDAERIQKLQDEMMKTQMQYQRELERLEKENKNLKQRLLLKDTGEQRRLRKIKRSLIDMYSEMLDLLNEYDSSYNITDTLPRVVVVGDQSAGKTSVLEMIAQARIFPRGSGEMMTRAPVKVTLSEGPYHVAQFKDSNREFDLTKESELEQLRNEIELRMRNSVADGKTVSNEVIALTVKGPSLPRMVLVDLPGVISTVTAGMARETKDDITRMLKVHMENPNAIILCIQDGSVDAERSNVTDLVSKVDPEGKRTILVLTKVDLAEKNLSNPHRIKRILEGKLFPMNAIGYFGVVTGKGAHNDSIEDIRRYEEEFFENSKLFKDGVLKPSQMTTRNMSMAVSEVFWRMVKDTIETQADAFKATRFNLETEWKNTFPKMRELDRDELFDKARSEILDECVNLSLISAEDWEIQLKEKFWKTISPYVFEEILLPALNVDNAGSFNTLLDIKLKQWVDTQLATKAIHVGWETLWDAYRKQFEQGAQARDHDPIFDKLKEAVLNTALEEHKWDKKALDYLRVIQLNAMEDRMVPDKRAWEKACSFFAEAIDERMHEVEKKLAESRGPGFWSRWLLWKSQTPENTVSQSIQNELNNLLMSNPEHKSNLSEDDITVIRRNLDVLGIIDFPLETIQQQWDLVYRAHTLERLKESVRDCYSFFQNYKQGNISDFEIDCHSIILFYRLQKMIDLSCNALRQQITNTEQRRLEKEIKEVLDDWSQEPLKKKELLTGRRVDLAEELRYNMASQITVKVHPLVLMTMVDSYERRSRKAGAKDQALGTLLGFYEKNAIQVTDCYAIPFRVSTSGMPEIDDAFNKEMYGAAKRTTPSEQIVGWFYTVSDLPNICEQFHIYYSHVVNALNVRRDQPPIVLLTLDVNFSEASKGGLPVRAFMRSECGIPKLSNHARIFQPLRVELDGFPGENVALDLIMKGLDSKSRETALDVGLNPIAGSVDQVIEWLERHLKYVDDILASDESKADPTVGRKLMEVVNTAATLLPQDKRENLTMNSLRDYMMISYLSNLTKTQLAVEERMIKN